MESITIDKRLIPFLLQLPARQVWMDYDAEGDVLYLSFTMPQQATDSVMGEDGNVCCGQGKTDTQLSNPSPLLICIGTDIPKIRVLPSAVVEHLDVHDNIVFCLLTRGVIPVCRPLAF